MFENGEMNLCVSTSELVVAVMQHFGSTKRVFHQLCFVDLTRLKCTDTARTFRKAAIEDVFLTSEKYETARITYDATRQKVAQMQLSNLDPITMRTAQNGLESKRNAFQQLGSDLATKMILLTEKRIQILGSRIQDYLNVNRKYYSACAQVFSSIDTTAMKTQNYKDYTFKALNVQQKAYLDSNPQPNNVTTDPNQRTNWEELKQQTQQFETPQHVPQAIQMNHQPVQTNPFEGPTPYAPNSPPTQTPTAWSSPPQQTPPLPRSPQPAIHNPQSPIQTDHQWDQPQPATPTGVVLTRGGKYPTPMPEDLEFL